MYNKIILMGNLTRDIELRYSQGGSAIGSTGLAVNRKWKSATGEQKEEVMFVDITFFGRTAEIAEKYLSKGKQVLVDGSLSLEQWTAQDGSKRSKHAVIVESLQMIGGKDERTSQPTTNQQAQGYEAAHENTQQTPDQQPTNNHSQPNAIPEIDIGDDEIPF